jgi:RNA polymerase sigma-70 factor (ECF subfamily)
MGTSSSGKDMSDESRPDYSPQRFPTTHWSLVGRAAGRAGDAGAGPVALGELIRVYLPALRAHLVGPMRVDPHRADDLLQAFLADKVLENNMIAAADPKRGKFRTFLLTALERFAIDVRRRETARKRSPGSKMLDVDDQSEQIVTKHGPSEAFDRAWAAEVLGEVMRRMRQECESTGRPYLWGIFEARMLLPITEGAEPQSHDDLAEQWKLESARQAANALGTAKRMFTRIFRSVVGQYAADEAEVDSEIRELWEIFARPHA